MRRALWVLVGLVAIQGVLLIVYLRIEASRQESAMAVERLDRPAPDIALQAIDGSLSRLSDRAAATVVVHFWATWCLPCRDELPSLLEFAGSDTVDVLAVSVDTAWDGVLSFVPPDSHGLVYRASADEAAEAFGVVDLPQTFVIDRTGSLRLHFSGPQDWSSNVVRETIAALR